MYYLAMDGGGTKLVGILFDEQYRLIATARAAGTHLSVYPLDEVKNHVQACYDALFAELPRPLIVERLYTICGDARLYSALLPDGVTLGSARNITEAISGLYAGSCRHSGFLALSGTGSDVFCIKDDQLVDVIGGWGAILGDEGSGVWMARHAMAAAIRHEQGWGAPTAFTAAVKEKYRLTELWDYVAYLYDTPSPFRRLGELLPLAAEVARGGDAVMENIFHEGGEILAAQMIPLLHRHPDVEPVITACGGAWKAHPAMAEAFCSAVTSAVPEATFTLPRFEHIMAGPLCLSMESGADMAAMAPRLTANFPSLVWNHHA